MEDPNSTLLPYILEILSRKPELCDTLENLCRDVEAQLIQEQNSKYGNVKTSIQRALSVGQSLGIINLTNENIRVPFSFRQGKNSKAPTISSANTAHQSETQPAGKSDKLQERNAQQQQQTKQQQPQPQQPQQSQQQQQQQPQQQQQQLRNTKSSKHVLTKPRYDESKYCIISPKILRRVPTPHTRARSSPRKVRTPIPRAKATSRGRRRRSGRRSVGRGKR